MTRIMLSSGGYFDLANPASSLFTIEDIAHGLSHICRFTGQGKHFYSVAQHCLMVSTLVPKELARLGLLHDAAEAFIGDVATPLKRLLPDYRRIEESVENEVYRRLGITESDLARYPEVKAADNQAFTLEKATLFGEASFLAHQTPAEAKAAFLKRFKELSDF